MIHIPGTTFCCCLFCAGRSEELKWKSSSGAMLLLLMLLLSSEVSGMVNMTAARQHMEETWWSSQFGSQSFEPEEQYFFTQVDSSSCEFWKQKIFVRRLSSKLRNHRKIYFTLMQCTILLWLCWCVLFIAKSFFFGFWYSSISGKARKFGHVCAFAVYVRTRWHLENRFIFTVSRSNLKTNVVRKWWCHVALTVTSSFSTVTFFIFFSKLWFSLYLLILF